MKQDGPETTIINPSRMRICFQSGVAATPDATAAKACPMKPKAIPKAAKIPANFAMSNA